MSQAFKPDNPFDHQQKADSRSGVIACDSTFAIGEVVVAGNYRYIITAEVSRVEFEQQLASNIARGGVMGSATMEPNSSGLARKAFRPGSAPDFDAKHYYRARVEFAKSARSAR